MKRTILLLVMGIMAITCLAQGEKFMKPDVAAQYPGGEKKLEQFIVRNFNYPDSLTRKRIEKAVTVRFVIDTDGGISQAQAVNPPDWALGEEAVRVVSMMPKWIPAKRNGKAVRSQYVLNMQAVRETNTKKLFDYYKNRKYGKTYRNCYVLSFPKGTWIEYANGRSHREEQYMSWRFDDTKGQTTMKLDGRIVDKDNLPDNPSTDARKIEIAQNGDRQTVNVVTRDIVVPDSVKDNVPREQTIALAGHNKIHIINRKAVPGDWIHLAVTDWEKNAWGYSVRDEFKHSRTKQDLKVYIYASTEATRGEIDRAVSILKELGISNYMIVKDIPIHHWTDEQYRQWAMKQKQINPKYDWQYLFDALAPEGVDGTELHEKWHIVKSVYGVK
ncbi:MAG: energy transducer TonB [Prevotellaceae bacterium]|nr:energy transducer TonB [Prevotellaceae bacterium]MDO4931135.1 energy transducer TonB [Prevotellaceae bacterium]